MKKLLLLTLFILSTLMSFHCRKAIETDSWIVGKWWADDGTSDLQSFDIKADGTGAYKSGPYKKVKLNDKSFKIGTKEFDIVEARTPFDSTGFRSSRLYDLYPPTNPPTMQMKVHLPLFQGHSDLLFYKWEH